MSCKLVKFHTRTKAGVFVGYRRPPQPRLNLPLMIMGNTLHVLPVNCWFSRTLRLFRRTGKVLP